jgi:hypothetical protein
VVNWGRGKNYACNKHITLNSEHSQSRMSVLRSRFQPAASRIHCTLDSVCCKTASMILETSVTIVDSADHWTLSHCPSSDMYLIYTTFRELALNPSSGDRIS